MAAVESEEFRFNPDGKGKSVMLHNVSDRMLQVLSRRQRQQTELQQQTRTVGGNSVDTPFANSASSNGPRNLFNASGGKGNKPSRASFGSSLNSLQSNSRNVATGGGSPNNSVRERVTANIETTISNNHRHTDIHRVDGEFKSSSSFTRSNVGENNKASMMQSNGRGGGSARPLSQEQQRVSKAPATGYDDDEDRINEEVSCNSFTLRDQGNTC